MSQSHDGRSDMISTNICFMGNRKNVYDAVRWCGGVVVDVWLTGKFAP